MTYPGTKPRERTALESSLTQDVLRLERERDELVEALRPFTLCDTFSSSGAYLRCYQIGWQDGDMGRRAIDNARVLIAKYRSSAGSRE